MSGHGYGFTIFFEIERRRLVGKGVVNGCQYNLHLSKTRYLLDDF